MTRLAAPWARRWVLRTFTHPVVARWVRRHGWRLGAGRFVAGEDRDAALAVAARLHRAGYRVSLTYLGEYSATAAQADQALAEYLAVLEQAAGLGQPVGLSIKLTQLGLDLDPTACLERARRLLAAAARTGAVVEVDMEDAGRVDAILAAHRNLAAQWPQLGVALQAYLRRSAADAARLAAMGARVRLVKGAYAEPPSLLVGGREAIHRQYLELAARLLDSGCFLAAATHDQRLIAAVRTLLRQRGLGPDRYEVQMLRGIHVRLRARLRAEGVPVRVLVTYGKEWYPWFVRRLAERPANALLLARNLLGAGHADGGDDA